jgi:hypothetical protein
MRLAFSRLLGTILAPFLAFLLGRIDLRARSAMRINRSVLARETPRTSAVSAAEANPLRMIALDITSPAQDTILCFHGSQFPFRRSTFRAGNHSPRTPQLWSIGKGDFASTNDAPDLLRAGAVLSTWSSEYLLDRCSRIQTQRHIRGGGLRLASINN